MMQHELQLTRASQPFSSNANIWRTKSSLQHMLWKIACLKEPIWSSKALTWTPPVITTELAGRQNGTWGIQTAYKTAIDMPGSAIPFRIGAILSLMMNANFQHLLSKQ